MSATKFTPGPWLVKESSLFPEAGDEWQRDILRVDADEGFHISSLVEGAYFVCESDEENIANARLIAAAPALYEALRLITENDHCPACIVESGAAQKARAALKKAVGE